MVLIKWGQSPRKDNKGTGHKTMLLEPETSKKKYLDKNRANSLE